MEITKEQSQQIMDLSLQLENKFGIKIGYMHPMGCFLSENDQFILNVEGSINKDNRSLCEEKFFLLDRDSVQIERKGPFVRMDCSEEKSDKAIDFLIDLNQWLKKGELKQYSWKKFKNWEWKPTGDGRFTVRKKTVYCESSFTAYLGDFPSENREIEEHISDLYMGE